MSTGGESAGIAYANDRVEAEMIRGLLETAGIPSAVQQLGIDGPLLGFGLLNPGGGSRRIMVHVNQAEAARAVLAESLVPGEPDGWDALIDADDTTEAPGRRPRNYNLIGAYARIWFWSFIAMGLAFAIFLLLRSI
jgi:putative signal transducing protein